MQNYKPTNFTIKNWGFIGDQDFIPTANGNLIITGENGSGKTSTMNAFIPFLLTGNLKDSSVFNTFDKSKDLDKPHTTQRTSSAARTLVNDILGNHDESNNNPKLILRNAQGQPFTNRIAYSAVTLDNNTDSFTLGVLIEVKNRKLHDQRWFILDDDTHVVPDITIRDQNNIMLPLDDFVTINQEKFDTKFHVYPTDALYRLALATRYGIQSPTKNADAFIQKYSSLIQLTGSGTLVSDQSLNITKLSNHIKHAMPAIDSELTNAILKDVLDELKDHLQIKKTTTVLEHVQEINQLKSILNYMSLYKDYQSQIGNINLEITKNNDTVTKLNNDLQHKTDDITSAKAHLTEAQTAQTKSQATYDKLNFAFKTKKESKDRLTTKKELLKTKQANNQHIHENIDSLNKEITELKATQTTLTQDLPNLEQDQNNIEFSLIGTFAKITASPIYQEPEDIWNQWDKDTVAEYQATYQHYHDLLKLITKNDENIKNSSEFVTTLSDILTEIQKILGNKPFIKSSVHAIQQIFDKHINNYSQNKKSLYDENQTIKNDLPITLRTISEPEIAAFVNLLVDFHASFEKHDTKLSEISFNKSRTNDIIDKISKKQANMKDLQLALDDDIDYQPEIDKIEQQINELMTLSQQKLADAKQENDENINIVNKQQQQVTILEVNQTKLKNNIDKIKTKNQALMQSSQDNQATFDHDILTPFNEHYQLTLTLNELTTHAYQPILIDGYKGLINKTIQTITKLLKAPDSDIFDNLNDIKSRLNIKINSLLNDDNTQHMSLLQELSQMNLNTDDLTNHLNTSYDYPYFELAEQLQTLVTNYQEKLSNETTYRYHNNNNVMRLTTELATQHVHFNQLLDQARDLLLQNNNTNTIRIRLEHMIDHNQFTNDYQQLINPNTSLDDKTNIVKQIILPHVDLENNNIDALLHDHDFKTEIKDCFDYRNWTHVNILMALANSNNFSVVTNKTLASASGGEKTKMIIIPLLTITRLHLQQGTAPSIPMLMSFDEFGSLLDDDNADDLLSTITEFGFSFIGSVPNGKDARLAAGNIPLAIYQVDKSPDNRHTNKYTNILIYEKDIAND